jgi:transcriptional regulator with XRE-family HTH domain
MKRDDILLAVAGVIGGEIERIGWTVADAVRASGVPDQSIRDYCQGRTEPSLSRLLALERAFHSASVAAGGPERPPGWISAEVTDVVTTWERDRTVKAAQPKRRKG